MRFDSDRTTAMHLLERMFEVELAFLRSDKKDVQILANAFHRDVVVHEPPSLPYAGDWSGLEGVGNLLGKMSEIWIDMTVEGLTAARCDDIVFLTCELKLISRDTGVVIQQPFAGVMRFKDGLLLDGTPFYYDTAEIIAAVR